MNKDFTSKAQDLISRGKIDRALDELSGIKQISDDNKDMLRLIQADLTNLTRQERMGTMSYSEAARERSKITSRLLGLLDDIQNDQTATAENESTVISFFAANPKSGMGDLRLNEEFREISEGLKRANKRDQFELESNWAVRTRDLLRALLDQKPNIVHFSGHGVAVKGDYVKGQRDANTRMLTLDWEEDSRLSADELTGYAGGIALESPDGDIQIVMDTALSALFSRFPSIKCVILNACHSQKQADAIIEHVDYVIGMNTEVPDRTAISFAISFYDALGAGESIENAFNIAKDMLLIDGLPGADIPEIMINPKINS